MNTSIPARLTGKLVQNINPALKAHCTFKPVPKFHLYDKHTCLVLSLNWYESVDFLTYAMVKRTHTYICKCIFFFLGLLWIECKQIYSSGVRDYLLDYYNFMDYTLLSLYLASYALRFIVDHYVRTADRQFNGTPRARESLLSGNYTMFNMTIDEIRNSRDANSHGGYLSYFMEACKYEI